MAAPGLKDTQCGFKCYRGEVVSLLFGAQRIYGFAFDAEVIFLACKIGLNVQEIGVDWYYGQGSKVRPLADSLVMAGDLLKIRWNHIRGRYSSFGTSIPTDISPHQ